MHNNIFKVKNIDDLIFLLKNAKKRVVVLSIITEETDEQITNMIKEFMKKKSIIYPNVTFLHYKAEKQDFGKLDPLFYKNMLEYPKLIHIWDIEAILCSVMAIDNEEIIEESFEEYHDFYLGKKILNDDGDLEDISPDTEELIDNEIIDI
jgi:hypothetical protein